MGRPRGKNQYIILGETSLIICKHGDVIVDTKNLNNLLKLKWFTKKSTNGTYYVYSSITENKLERKVVIHRHLLDVRRDQIIDHINRNPLDNRIENLRICTKGENNRNAKKNKRGTTSKYKGVSKLAENKYKAVIQYECKKFHLGQFKTEEDAAFAYNKKALQLFGEYANINIVSKETKK